MQLDHLDTIAAVNQKSGLALVRKFMMQ